MFRFGRLVRVALEDFGVRPPVPAGAPVVAPPPRIDVPVVPMTSAPEPFTVPSDLPPGVVWQGAAPRRPELQRFVDDLESRRAAALAST